MKEVMIILWSQAGGGRPPGGLLDTPQTVKSLWSEVSAVTVVLGAALVVGLVLFLAVYWWKRAPGEGGVAASGSPGHRACRGKRRKRLPRHRPRNPTLAETGGLPPLRDEPPAGSSPSPPSVSSP